MKLSTFLFLLIMPFTAHAFFCPGNFSNIEFGETIGQVTTACGNPDRQKTYNAEPKVPQEWSYFISQTVATQSMTPQTGTLKTTITFDKEGKAINVSVNGIGVGSSSICGNPIQLGSTLDDVKSACGKPAFVNKQVEELPPGATPELPTKITEFTYNSDPPVTLIFTAGVLTDKK